MAGRDGQTGLGWPGQAAGQLWQAPCVRPFARCSIPSGDPGRCHQGRGCLEVALDVANVLEVWFPSGQFCSGLSDSQLAKVDVNDPTKQKIFKFESTDKLLFPGDGERFQADGVFKGDLKGEPFDLSLNLNLNPNPIYSTLTLTL